MTGRSPPPTRPLAGRVTLDLLGLGVEQAYAHLLGTRPGLDAFAAWVVATAGPPDPVRVARLDASMDGAPVTAEAAERLRAVDAMPPALDAEDLHH